MCLGLGHVGIATIEWLGLSAVAAALELREDQWEVEACVVAGCGGDARIATLSYLACAPGARKKCMVDTLNARSSVRRDTNAWK